MSRNAFATIDREYNESEERLDVARANLLEHTATMSTYTGPERRWMKSRPHSDWTSRDAQWANQSALHAARSAALLLVAHDRAKGEYRTALWDGYWLVKNDRDELRARVAKETTPWFDGRAFREEA